MVILVNAPSATCAIGEPPGGGIRRGSSLERKIRGFLTQIIDGLLQYAREIVPIAGSVELRTSRSVAAAEIRSRWAVWNQASERIAFEVFAIRELDLRNIFRSENSPLDEILKLLKYLKPLHL